MKETSPIQSSQQSMNESIKVQSNGHTQLTIAIPTIPIPNYNNTNTNANNTNNKQYYPILSSMDMD